MLVEVDERNRDGSVAEVLSVTEGRGIIPQREVFKKRIATDDTTEYKVVRSLDIAWNPYLLWTGAVGQWLGNEPGVTSPVYPVFRARKGQAARFWGLVLDSGLLTPYFDSTAIGSIQRRRRTTIPAFNDAVVRLPPHPEQRRIVDVMDAVDAQVEALEAEIGRCDRLWWSLGHDMVVALEGMDRVRLDAIAQVSGGITKNKKDLDRPDLIEVPYLRVANVHRRYLDLTSVATIRTTPAKAEALRLLPGDVLFNEGGDRDKLGRGDVWRGQLEHCIHQNHVFRARVVDPRFDPRFVSAWGNTFGQRWFETFGTQTTGIASINKSTLSRFPIPDVATDVQVRWADQLDAVVTAHDAARSELAHLRMFRSTLLTGLLNQDVEIPASYDDLVEDAG